MTRQKKLKLPYKERKFSSRLTSRRKSLQPVSRALINRALEETSVEKCRGFIP